MSVRGVRDVVGEGCQSEGCMRWLGGNVIYRVCEVAWEEFLLAWCMRWLGRVVWQRGA